MQPLSSVPHHCDQPLGASRQVWWAHGQHELHCQILLWREGCPIHGFHELQKRVISQNAIFHDYDTRSRDKLRKIAAKRRLSHWACINFATNEKKFSLSSFNRLRTITTTQKNNVSPPPHFFEQSIKAAVCLLYFQNFNFCCNPSVQFQTEHYNISVTRPLQVIQQERGPSPRAIGQREISRYNNTRACSHTWRLEHEWELILLYQTVRLLRRPGTYRKFSFPWRSLAWSLSDPVYPAFYPGEEGILQILWIQRPHRPSQRNPRV